MHRTNCDYILSSFQHVDNGCKVRLYLLQPCAYPYNDYNNTNDSRMSIDYEMNYTPGINQNEKNTFSMSQMKYKT